MWSITHTSPTWPAVFGSRQHRVRPLYIETCCLPRIDSHETQETPVWPTHDVTGMCISEFKTHPLSSWHHFTIIIAQPQPSFCDPCRRSCLAVAVFSWGPGPELRLRFLRVCRAACWMLTELSIASAQSTLCISRFWAFLCSWFRVGKGAASLSLEIACGRIWLLWLEPDWNFQIQMTVKPHTGS